MRRRHRTDSSWWRRATADGDIVVAGSPLRLFRFSSTARSTLDALETASTTPPEADVVVRRLVEAGAVHPIVDESSCTTPGDVTVVIPVRDESAERLGILVASLSDAHRVVVVDDGSATPVTPIDGAVVVRRPVSGGPAAARNTAIDLVDTPLVLFLDADTVFDAGIWDRLLAPFDDDTVTVVAPRIRSIDGPGVLARYERTDSPLDLGDEPARILPNTRVSYAPTAGLVIRTRALVEHGGFDEMLRYGEDVDLVWRLGEAGGVLRYEPSVEIGHRPRPTMSRALRQRFDYGSAAVPLESRHPGGASPLRLNRWTAAAWAAVGTGHPVIGFGLATASTMRLARRLEPDIGRRTAYAVAAHLAGRGNLHAGRLVATALWRTWWPITVVLSVVSRNLRRTALVALVLPGVLRWYELRRAGRTDLDPLTYTAMRVADDVAYGAGVWKAVVAARDARALRPRID